MRAARNRLAARAWGRGVTVAVDDEFVEARRAGPGCWEVRAGRRLLGTVEERGDKSFREFGVPLANVARLVRTSRAGRA